MYIHICYVPKINIAVFDVVVVVVVDDDLGSKNSTQTR